MAYSVAMTRERRRQQALQMLGGKCQVCGYDKCDRALSFHHIDPSTKSATVSTLIGNNKSWDIVKEEIEKCQLLCANCHMELHARE